MDQFTSLAEYLKAGLKGNAIKVPNKIRNLNREERKKKRDDLRSNHRMITDSPMPPTPFKKSKSAVSVKMNESNQEKNEGMKDNINNEIQQRMEQLARWRENRNKQKALEKAKAKPVFKSACHIDHDKTIYLTSKVIPEEYNFAPKNHKFKAPSSVEPIQLASKSIRKGVNCIDAPKLLHHRVNNTPKLSEIDEKKAITSQASNTGRTSRQNKYTTEINEKKTKQAFKMGGTSRITRQNNNTTCSNNIDKVKTIQRSDISVVNKSTLAKGKSISSTSIPKVIKDVQSKMNLKANISKEIDIENIPIKTPKKTPRAKRNNKGTPFKKLRRMDAVEDDEADKLESQEISLPTMLPEQGVNDAADKTASICYPADDRNNSISLNSTFTKSGESKYVTPDKNEDLSVYSTFVTTSRGKNSANKRYQTRHSKGGTSSTSPDAISLPAVLLEQKVNNAPEKTGSIVDNRNNTTFSESEDSKFVTPDKKEDLNVYISPFVTMSRGKKSAYKEYKSRHSPDITNITAGANYFYKLLDQEISRMKELILAWENYQKQNDLPEEPSNMINVAIGQSNLLMSKKMKQFRQLIDQSLVPTDGPSITCADLHGFWDMVMIQVNNVTKRFDNLVQLRDNNWEEIMPENKRVVKEKAVKRVLPKRTAKKASSKLRDAIKAARANKQGTRKSFKDSPGLAMMKATQTAHEISGFTPAKSILKPATPISTIKKRNKSVLFKENAVEIVCFHTSSGEDDEATPRENNAHVNILGEVSNQINVETPKRRSLRKRTN